VDFAPGKKPYMHRTESLDYGVVLEGTVELELDSGETRIMNRGDMCVQRATNHAWKNVTENDGWARMMFVLVSSEKVIAGGKELGEELGDMSEAVPRNSKM
jgi:quercetin dioxygenase-like cupin family protein